jgi:hypothetical protein
MDRPFVQILEARVMKTILQSILALTAVLTLSACASDRPCPPGSHLGPWGHACHPN